MIQDDLNPVFDDLIDMRLCCSAGDEQSDSYKTIKPFSHFYPPPEDSMIIDQPRQKFKAFPTPTLRASPN